VKISVPISFLLVGASLIANGRAYSLQIAPASAHTQSSNSPKGLQEEFEQAKRLIDDGKLDEAIQILTKLRLEKSKPKEVEHELGLAYYRKGDFADAQSAFANALDENPEDREVIQLRGLTLYQLGRPAEAIPYLQQVQSWIGSASVDSNYVLGLCYIHTQKYDEARQSFAKMYGVLPNSAAAYLFLARMLLRQEYDSVAEQNARQAATMDPKLPLVHFLLGEFYLYKSNVEKAIEEFELEQRLNPAYAGTYDRLGDSYSRIGKYDDAERALQRAILLDATATGPYILMGKVLIKKKDFSSATTYLQKALRMDPSNYISHHLMGDAYRGLGRAADAERELKKAEELQSAQESKPQG
jgi:tetratricopeptide (TPR) repeat protein